MIALLLLLIFAAATAHGQCTQWSYMGAPFTVVTASSDNALLISGPVVGTVTLAAPLAANMSNVTATITAWNFDEENLSGIGPGTPGSDEGATFIFSTDANGNITDWSVNLYWTDNSEAPYLIEMTSTPAGDTVSASEQRTEPPLAEMTVNGSSSTAGTWTCIASFAASYTAPPDPPAPNPLAATVAALQAQVASLQAQVTALTTEANGLIAEKANLQATNASLVTEYRGLAAYWEPTLAADTTEIAALTAEVEKLK